MPDNEAKELHSQERAYREKEHTKAKEDLTYNGYALALYIFTDVDKDDVKYSDIKDPDLYAFLCYSLALLFSLMISLYAVRKNRKKLVWFGTMSLTAIMIPLAVFYFTGILEDISQIKYGYYLFLMNGVAIVLLALKTHTKERSNAI